MNIKFIWISVFVLFCSAQVHLSRSAHKEMNEIKQLGQDTSRVNMDEYWPFPNTINDADPLLLELRLQLMKMNKES